MIIDKILDRKDGQNIIIRNGQSYTTKEYNAKRFYDEMMGYSDTGGDKIAEAMDSGEEEDVKRELIQYIVSGEYNPAIIEYINSVNWV